MKTSEKVLDVGRVGSNPSSSSKLLDLFKMLGYLLLFVLGGVVVLAVVGAVLFILVWLVSLAWHMGGG